MMQTGMASPDLVEDDRKTNLIVNYLPQTMTQVSLGKIYIFKEFGLRLKDQPVWKLI